MSKRNRLLVSVPLVVVLLCLAMYSASFGLANLQVLKVEHFLDEWGEAGGVVAPEQVAQAHDAIDRAINLHADNPYQFSLKARVLEWEAGGLELGRSEAFGSYREAMRWHQRAIQYRPLWPDSWAELALLKIRLGEFDEVLDRYLVKADQLGAYTPMVHKAVVLAGFARLQQDPFTEPALLKLHVLRGLQGAGSRKQVVELIEAYGQKTMVCRWIALADEPVSGAGLCRP